MNNNSNTREKWAKRRIDNLLRGVRMALFSAGAFAIGVLWVFESKLTFIEEVCRIA